MSNVLMYNTVIWFTECYVCSVPIGMPKDMYENRLEDHRSFWCPSGHETHFVGKTPLEKEKDARIRAEARLALANDRAELAERRRRAAKGQLTKVTNRVKNGVCPFCKRSFADLRDHMASKHSEVEAHA
jgi:hypothetical protein